jgi:hypothetical protein
MKCYGDGSLKLALAKQFGILLLFRSISEDESILRNAEESDADDSAMDVMPEVLLLIQLRRLIMRSLMLSAYSQVSHVHQCLN